MSKKAFTLLEVLIVVTLIVVIAVVALVLLDPFSQISRARDSQRKNDLATLQKVLEDYYNDKGCYPPPNKICYDTPVDVKKGTVGSQPTIGQKCHICGSESSSPSFSPYLSRLPCDPQHLTKDYLYNYDCPSGGPCPLDCNSLYRVYASLSLEFDVVCSIGGCGPPPAYGYDYGISSSNTNLSQSKVYNCVSPDNKCNVCNTYEQCISPGSGCKQPYIIYGSTVLCCQSNPPSYCR